MNNENELDHVTTAPTGEEHASTLILGEEFTTQALGEEHPTTTSGEDPAEFGEIGRQGGPFGAY